MLSVIKALADPTRLRLVGILEHGEFTVQELVSILEMGQSRISRHLKILVEARICSVERQGTWSYFRMNSGDDFFHSIRPEILKRINSVEGYGDDQVGVARTLDERRKKSQQFFDQHARQWDKMASDLIPVDRYAAYILNELDSGHIVVDVGVGTGRLLKDLSLASRHVIGIDHSAPMLDEARNRIQEEQLENIELRLGELTHLPVADGVANCAILNMVLHHAANPHDAFMELNRVLEPGGQLILADLVRHDLEWFQEQMADQWMGFAEKEIDRWLDATGYRRGHYQKIEIDDKRPSVFVLTAEKISS
jgi:ArsR family transcriptional regulator